MQTPPPPTARQSRKPFLSRTDSRHDGKPLHRDPILDAGRTCWRIARSDRVKILVDAAEYFSTLRQALLRAQRSVHILGWDIDSRVDLAPDGAPDDEPTRLRPLLIRLVEINPQLRVNLLLWDYSTLYALDREPLPRISLGWQTPAQIDVCLDDLVPLGSSHHQKLVVIDDKLAFCGGLDLCSGRWDTPDHSPDLPARVDPDGVGYGPFHDVHMMVDGDAAAAIAELVHLRWHEASCRHLTPVTPEGDPWPEDVIPDVTDVDVGIARTLPLLLDRAEVREIEALFIAAIASAERLVYMENQYFAAVGIADALAHRLTERPELEAILVCPRLPHGWLAAKAMGAGRRRFRRRLEEAGVAHRVRLVSPSVDDTKGTPVDIMVHSKVLIVDDRFITIGSANVNNRSMGCDTECNLALEATADQPELHAAIADIRNRLLGEHLGRPAETIGQALREPNSARALVDAAGTAGRKLSPIEPTEDDEEDLVAVALAPIADPERPIEADQLLLDLFGGITRHAVWPWLKRGAAGVGVILGFVALWQWTPLSELITIDTLRPIFEVIRAGAAAPIAIPLLFVIASLLFFPITLLITLTAIVFDPLFAFAYALVGTMASAAAAYGVGFKLGRPVLRRLLGNRLNSVNRAVASRGVLAVMMLRVAPVAPYTAVNMVCGAARIRFTDYMVGTLLGMAPGITVLTALGNSLTQVLENPTPGMVALVIAAIALWILLGVGLQRILGRWRGMRRDREARS
ncbi:MAG: VTT domain-containing protein [Rhodospirillales bacterium]|nr:VTT domain-containing protein [Rhodospirillales bacterium]